MADTSSFDSHIQIKQYYHLWETVVLMYKKMTDRDWRRIVETRNRAEA
jgi:hypothetical protein